MINSYDDILNEVLNKNFDMPYHRNLNDYSFNIVNDMSFFTHISLLSYREPEEYRRLKDFIESYKSDFRSDIYVAIKAYCHYVEKEFDKGIKLIWELLDNSPSNIDNWIDLSFFMAYIPDGYDTFLNMRFHLYHYIRNYFKYNFHTLDFRSLNILSAIVRQEAQKPEIRENYNKEVKFVTEYLFINGNCNNNCVGCHIPADLKGYDFDERVSKHNFMPLSKYIYCKVRQKALKTLVIKGGEPTLHKSYLKVMKMVMAIRPDIRVQVNTNGRIFCNPSFRKRHNELKSDSLIFEVSLFSSDPKIHDAHTRTDNSLSQTLQGLENLLEDENKSRVNIKLTPESIGTLGDTIQSIVDKYSGNRDFEGIVLSLPYPSAGNLDRYTGSAVRSLYTEAAKVLEGFKSVEPQIRFTNDILANI